MKTINLIPTHNSLRSVKTLDYLCKVLKKRGYFGNCIPEYTGNKIRLAIFEDEKIYVRDGHHRCCAAHLIKQELDPRDYVLERWDYRDWTKPNFDKGWITPFDPRTEVRFEDYTHFRESYYFRNIEWSNLITSSHYKLPRKVWNLGELIINSVIK
jgi:hypothetical protein